MTMRTSAFGALSGVLCLLLAACGTPPANTSDAGGGGADASADSGGPGGGDAWAEGGMGAMRDCGPNGEFHEGHCDCNEGYYDNETTCVAFPMCSMPNDMLEPNNTSETATAVPAGMPFTRENLRVCPGDRDIYKVTLAAGQTLTAALTFMHARGDVDMYLFPPGADLEHLEEAGTPVAFSDGTVDNERFEFRAMTAGEYQLLVLAVGPAENSYGLSLTTSGP